MWRKSPTVQLIVRLNRDYIAKTGDFFRLFKKKSKFLENDVNFRKYVDTIRLLIKGLQLIFNLFLSLKQEPNWNTKKIIEKK